jgi:hypothetical protein
VRGLAPVHHAECSRRSGRESSPHSDWRNAALIRNLAPGNLYPKRSAIARTRLVWERAMSCLSLTKCKPLGAGEHIAYSGLTPPDRSTVGPGIPPLSFLRRSIVSISQGSACRAGQHYYGTGENIMFKRIKQPAGKPRQPKRRTQPQPEEDLGGGDICSLQEQPSTDDDQPLD